MITTDNKVLWIKFEFEVGWVFSQVAKICWNWIIVFLVLVKIESKRDCISRLHIGHSYRILSYRRVRIHLYTSHVMSFSPRSNTILDFQVSSSSSSKCCRKAGSLAGQNVFWEGQFLSRLSSWLALHSSSWPSTRNFPYEDSQSWRVKPTKTIENANKNNNKLSRV